MSVSPSSTTHNFRITKDQQGVRLDHFLVRSLEGSSRSKLGRCIREGHILVNKLIVKPGYKLRAGDAIQVEIPVHSSGFVLAQPIDFQILHEDKYLAVISKPPGLVVHPAAGHADKTLVNGLLHRYPDLPGQAGDRPGIVHRLDKDTSGIMLVARTEEVQRLLSEAFKNRLIDKSYRAVLLRCPPDDTGRIEAPIGRHPVQRKKMAVNTRRGRYAVTRWKVVERFSNGMCFAKIAIETGRTHQIRVHMASVGAPVAGDALYGGKPPGTAACCPPRQLLHAATLSFIHPITGEKCCFSAPIWDDMFKFLKNLQEDFVFGS